MSESAAPCTEGADAVLIPVYNEAATVNDVLDAVLCEFSGTVIVVDDGSTDGTGDALKARDDIVLLEHGHNEGYGRALADGFALARVRGVRRLVTMDCDGQHEPARMLALLKVLDETGVDIVSGSRYLPGSPVAGIAPSQRREVNERVTAVVNAVTGWGITDAFCGFKAYCMSSLSKLQLKEPGYAMPMELWARAYRADWRVIEVPVERIYFDNDRTFGEDLDNPEKRFGYYMRIWRDALHGE
ncbi:MAG: glycosyltransferase family 2 protein [Coriobacteriia bacterium]|nr:glycosyltransferase family 2 protein [Coriobacteriia bacterium]